MSSSNNNVDSSCENGEQELSDGWSKVEDEGQSSSLSGDLTQQTLNITGEGEYIAQSHLASSLNSRANSWIVS